MMNYVELLKHIESCRVDKSKDNITRDGQDWYWCPKHNMEDKFYAMYMNYPSKKHDEWAE